MTKLTIERIKEIHDEYSNPNHSKSFSVKDCEIAVMAETALAALTAGIEQEPAGFIHPTTPFTFGKSSSAIFHKEMRHYYKPVFAAQQLPQPEPITIPVGLRMALSNAGIAEQEF